MKWWFTVPFVAILLFVRLPFLAPTLEDVDSVNFDLGVHSYNPALHRPHPPGYPVYILLAKASHFVFADHATALAVLSATAGSLSFVPLYILMRQLTTPAAAILACVFTLFSPLVWFNSVRPMSDLVGFLAATSAQALLLTSGRHRAWRWHLAAGLAGLAAGIRLQTILLTLPVLCALLYRQRSRWFSTVLAVGAGVCVWAVPLVVLMGGPAAAAASFAPVVNDTVTMDSLIPHWTPRAAALAALDVLIAPWQATSLGLGLLLLAAMGLVMLARTEPRRLMLLVLLFVPYGVFHYLFQDTDTLRYVIPVVPLTAVLAAVPLVQARWGRMVAPAAAAVFVLAASVVTVPALQSYHSTPSPMMQAVAAARDHAASERVVVSGHFAFERYLPLLPAHLERLPLNHPKEWQSLTEYWISGRREPVLYLREAHRTDLLQFGRDTRQELGLWEWPMPVRPFLIGARPGRIRLARLDPPRWAIESGAFVTDEAGPYENVRRQPHRFYVRTSRSPQIVIVSGFVDDPHERVELSLRADLPERVGDVPDDQMTRTWHGDGSFTLRAPLAPDASRKYVPLVLQAAAPVTITDVWVASDGDHAVRPAGGFHSPERDGDARLFRWMAPNALANVYLPSGNGVLTIEGWIPVKYYDLPVTMSIKWNGQPVASLRIGSERFRERVRISAPQGSPWGELSISASHSFIPDALARNGDRRVLSLRIYELSAEPAPQSLQASRQPM
jgi:hypothetical protein